MNNTLHDKSRIILTIQLNFVISSLFYYLIFTKNNKKKTPAKLINIDL